MTVVLGFDPGLSGAWACVDTERSLLVEDFPVHKVQSGKTIRAELDIAALHATLLLISAAVDHAFIERVAARPGQGVTSMFRFGYASGLVHGLITALGVPCTFVTPQRWQAATGVGAGPDAARRRAAQLWPDYAPCFQRKCDQHRADAALIAAYGASVLAAAVPGRAA